MPALIDLTAKRFGSLIVLQRNGINHSRRRMWLCRCDCGQEREVDGQYLRTGRVSSCGCLRSPGRLPQGEAGFRKVFRQIKDRARRKSQAFALSEAEVRDLTRQPCYYCGATAANVAVGHGAAREYGQYTYNGLDRIDSHKGYTAENVVSCCRICNIAKSNLTQWEFANWVTLAWDHAQATGWMEKADRNLLPRQIEKVFARSKLGRDEALLVLNEIRKRNSSEEIK